MKYLPMIFIMVLFTLMLSCGSGGDTLDNDIKIVPQSIKKAIPVKDALELTLPDRSTQSNNKRATYWELSRSAISGVNNVVWSTLEVMQEIKLYQPDLSDESKTVWELAETLDYSTEVFPRLSVERESDSNYKYTYAARNAHKSDAQWILIFTGQMAVDPNEAGMGAGEFSIDFSAAQRANPMLARTGQVDVSFESAADADQEVTIDYKNYIAENSVNGLARDTTSKYLMRSDGTGYFEYSTLINWTASDELEKMQINSKWLDDGSGIVQVFITGTDISGKDLDMVELRECRDKGFGKTYFVQINRWKDSTGLEPTNDNEEGDVDSCTIEFEDPTI